MSPSVINWRCCSDQSAGPGSAAGTGSSGLGSHSCGQGGGPASSLSNPRPSSPGTGKAFSSTGAGSPGAAQRVARRSILSSARSSAAWPERTQPGAGAGSKPNSASSAMRSRSSPLQSTWGIPRRLGAHIGEIVAVDFFVVSTLTFRLLFGFLILQHNRRALVHVNVTDHPTAAWTAHQLVESFPEETAPKYLLRDRDAIYGDVFVRRVEGLGISEILIAPRAPWQNPFAERVIGSIRRECLDHVIVFNEQHLRRLLRRYLAYYNATRPHQSLPNARPHPRAVQTPAGGRIVAIPQVGGLHHRYQRAA